MASAAVKKPAETPTARPANLEQRFTNLLTRLLRVGKDEINKQRDREGKNDHEKTRKN